MGGSKKSIAKNADNVAVKTPKKALKNVEEPNVSSKHSKGDNILPEKQKTIDVENPSKKKVEIKNEVPEKKKLSEAKFSEEKIIDKELYPPKKNLDKVDAPKDKQVAAGEKPPKSEILDDNPNLKDTELDNFKKHEDNVDPAKKKKMKEDADGEVGKGKDHDSKVKALVMARVITKANDKIDTPIPALLTQLAPLKAMKGVKNFKAKSQGNGHFEIYLIGSKFKVDDYDIDPEKEKNRKEKPKKPEVKDEKDANFEEKGVKDKATKGVTRSLDNLSSLEGATWNEAKSSIPKDWISGPMKKGEGIKFVNPAKKGEQILLEKGWPGAKDPLHAGPYMKVSRDGKITRIPLQGNPTLK